MTYCPMCCGPLLPEVKVIQNLPDTVFVPYPEIGTGRYTCAVCFRQFEIQEVEFIKED
jgi:hypothetical protein